MKTTFTILMGLTIVATLAAVPAAAATAVKGVVEDGDGKKVENATVWLIPAADVAAMGKTPIEIKRDSPNDEPLEDNLAANRERYLKAKSEQGRKFSIANVPGGKYFLYVEPANATLPARRRQVAQGSGHRELTAAAVTVKVSGNTPSDATYVGTTKCMKCHEDHEHFTKTLHRLGISVIGKPSKLQDFSRFPDFNKGLNKLMAGTKFWFHGYDKARGFDKYQISDKAPADPSTVSFTATFYKDTDGKLKFRTENARTRRPGARLPGGNDLRRRPVQAALPLSRRRQPVPLRAVQPRTARTAMATAPASPGATTTATGCSTRTTKKLTDPPRASPSTRNARPATTPATR